jgi:hypothetical protein
MRKKTVPFIMKWKEENGNRSKKRVFFSRIVAKDQEKKGKMKSNWIGQISRRKSISRE